MAEGLTGPDQRRRSFLKKIYSFGRYWGVKASFARLHTPTFPRMIDFLQWTLFCKSFNIVLFNLFFLFLFFSSPGHQEEKQHGKEPESDTSE